MPDPASRMNPEVLNMISRPVHHGENLAVCGVPACTLPHRTANLCVGHYMQLYKWRHRQGLGRIRHDHSEAIRIADTYDGTPTDDCLVTDCDRPTLARGLCRMHYTRAARAKGARW